ncbi:MAG TPA: ABC transporter ATP-binding protein [Candidatus Saccharimonadales bacterium]|nr:ABC transporter ATP-binding protein [Candidatus Saccharimonadales bacterium]
MKKHPALRAFFSYIGQFKGPFWATAALFAAADVAIAIVPWLIGRLTHSLTTHDAHVALWTALLIAASIGHDMLWRASEFTFLKLLLWRGQRFDDDIFNAVLQQPYSFFVDKFTGKVSSYAGSLGNQFRELLDNFHYNYLNLMVSMPIIAVTMFTVNRQTGMVFVVSLACMFLVGRVLARRAAQAERVEADERSNIDGYAVDAIANFVSIKAFSSEQTEAKRLFSMRKALIRANRTSGLRDIFFWGAMSIFVRWIIWTITFVLNVHLYLAGQLSLAQVTTFLAAIVVFSDNVWEVIWNTSQLNVKIASVDEAYRYLFGERNIFRDPLPPAPTPLPADAFKYSLEIRNLTFAYPDKPDVAVLHNINLRIRQGEKIGLVGPSGGGKSTLVKLLLGYYQVPTDELLLDHKPTDNRRLTSITAYVPQDTSMFHRSIRENIAYGQPGTSEARVIVAAKHAQADEFIRQLDAGYDTLVGERGIKLSGGQRQRIAIARAVLKDAPLLMLDEATSALDSESEKAIQAALWELMKNRTAVVIAHRLSTIQKMDRIVVLDQGRVVEEGTHAKLLKKGGLYARLWAHQSGGFIEE